VLSRWKNSQWTGKNEFKIKNIFKWYKMIVSHEYRKTRGEIGDMLKNMQDCDITPEFLLMVDFAYHNIDSNYDDGLSFLDRLHWKLSKYFPIQWNLANLKKTIRNSSNPSTAFVDILNEILDEEMIACYGV
jgi:hypothetical protein